MNSPRKAKALPPDDLSKDRLTFSAWPPKVDGVGKGVDKAFIIALAVVGLLVLMVIVGAVRPVSITSSPVEPVAKLLWGRR
ncbi:hypothetical protein [Caulobacter sp. BP25]|uniref:hypothetical protein n=1 Tax=Caulobacter sp. BP25 TaxID=2048900 RepID=UPI000C12C00D|nr:hypothetical protein [Caulobacter sp. BP25]PHY22914.1 hypothetical protein CSW59_00570 [Caulobacter sp. BP25]